MSNNAQSATTLRAHRFPVSRSTTPAARTRALVPLTAPAVSPTSKGNSSLNDFHRIVSPSETGASLSCFPQLGSTVISASEFPPALLSSTSSSPAIVGHYAQKHTVNPYSHRQSPSGISMLAAGKAVNASGDGFGMMMAGVGSHGLARRVRYPSSGVVGSRGSPVSSMPGGGVMGFGAPLIGIGSGAVGPPSSSFEARGHSPLQSTTEAVVTVVMPIPGASVVRDEQEAMWRAAEEDDNANTDRVQVKVEGYFEQDEVCGLIPSEMPRSRVLYVLTASEGRDKIFKTMQYSLLVLICLLKRPYLFSPDAASFLDMWAVRFWNNYNTIRHSRSLFKLGSWILNLFQAQSALERLAVVHKRILLRFLRSFTRVFCLPIANALSIRIPRFFYLTEEEEEEDRRRRKLYNVAFGNTNSPLLQVGSGTSHSASGFSPASASKKLLDYPERFASSVLDRSNSEEIKSTTFHESRGLSLSPADSSALFSFAAAKRQVGIDFSASFKEVQEGRDGLYHKCSDKNGGEDAERTEGEKEGEPVNGDGRRRGTEKDTLDQDSFLLKRYPSGTVPEWERRQKKSSVAEVDDMLLGGVYAHVSDAERLPGTNVGVGKTSSSFLGISDALASGIERISSTTTAFCPFPFLRTSPATPPCELPYASSPLPEDQFFSLPDEGMQEGSTSMRLKYADLSGDEMQLLSSKAKKNPVCFATCQIPSFPAHSLTSYPSKEERSSTNETEEENIVASTSERLNRGTATAHESVQKLSSENDVERKGKAEYSTIVKDVNEEKKKRENSVPNSIHLTNSRSAAAMSTDRHGTTAHAEDPSSLPLSASLCTDFCSLLSDGCVVRVVPPRPSPGTASTSDASRKATPPRIGGSHPHSLSLVHQHPNVLNTGQVRDGEKTWGVMESPPRAVENADNSFTLDYRYDEDSPSVSGIAIGGEGSTTEKAVNMDWIDTSEMDGSKPKGVIHVNASHTERTTADHDTSLSKVLPSASSTGALASEGKTVEESDTLSSGDNEKFPTTKKREHPREGREKENFEESEKSYVTRSPSDRYLEQTLGPNDRRPPTPSPAVKNVLPISRDAETNRRSESEDSSDDLGGRAEDDDEVESAEREMVGKPPGKTKYAWSEEEKQENETATRHSQVSSSQRSSDTSVEDEDEALLFYHTDIKSLSSLHKQESEIVGKVVQEPPASSSIPDPLHSTKENPSAAVISVPPERRQKPRPSSIFSQEFLKPEFSNEESSVPEWPGALVDGPPHTIVPSNGVPKTVVHLATTNPRVSHDTAPIPLLPTGQETMSDSGYLRAPPANDGYAPQPGFLCPSKPLDASDVLTPESVTVALLEASRRGDNPFGGRQNLNDPLKDGGIHGKIFGGGERSGERPSTLPYGQVPTSSKENITTSGRQTTDDASPSHPTTSGDKVKSLRGEENERGARSEDLPASSSPLSVFSSPLSSPKESSSSSELQRAAIPAATALPSQGRQSPYQFRKPLMLLFLIRSLTSAARRFLRDATLLSSERFFILKKVERNRHRIHSAINIFWFVSATIDLILSTTRVFQKGWLQYASSRQNIYCRCGCKILEDPADFTCRVQGMVVRRKTDLFFPPLDLDYGAPAASNIGFFEAADPQMMRPACTRCGCIYSVPVQRVYTSENPANQASVEDSDRGKSVAAAQAAAAAVAAAGGESGSLTEFPSDMNSTTRRNCADTNSSSTKAIHPFFTSGGGTRGTPTYRSSSVGIMTGMSSSSVFASKLALKSPLQSQEVFADKPTDSTMRRRSSSKLFSHQRGDSGGSNRKLVRDGATSFTDSRSSPVIEMRKFGEEGAMPHRTDSSTNGEEDVGLLLVPWVMRRLFNYVWLAFVHENFTATLLMHLNYMAQWYLAYQYTFGNFESYRRDTPLKDVLHLDGAVAGLLSALVVLFRVIKSAPS